METCYLIPEALSLMMAKGGDSLLDIGVTVWSNTTLASGTCFYPDEGTFKLENLHIFSTLRGDDIRHRFGCSEDITEMDGRPVRHCNWVRFLQRTINLREANMVATNQQRMPCFKTREDIPCNTEILVYFEEALRSSYSVAALTSNTISKKDDEYITPKSSRQTLKPQSRIESMSKVLQRAHKRLSLSRADQQESPSCSSNSHVLPTPSPAPQLEPLLKALTPLHRLLMPSYNLSQFLSPFNHFKMQPVPVITPCDREDDYRSDVSSEDDHKRSENDDDDVVIDVVNTSEADESLEVRQLEVTPSNSEEEQDHHHEVSEQIIESEDSSAHLRSPLEDNISLITNNPLRHLQHMNMLHHQKMGAHLLQSHQQKPALPFPHKFIDNDIPKPVLDDASKSVTSPGPLPTVKRNRHRTWLPCEVCGKKFDRPSLLRRHMRVHTGEKPHVCDVCSKAFSTSSSLNTHRRIHSGEKPHQCPICLKRFTASSNLYYHRMTHNKEKPHKCTSCSKSFPTPGDLKSHMYIHNGSWPFKCDVCNRGFSKQTNLRNHMLLHTGAKPFECLLCNKKFALQCNMKTHVKTHEGEQKSRCVTCSKEFLVNSAHQTSHCSQCIKTTPTQHLHQSTTRLQDNRIHDNGTEASKLPNNPLLGMPSHLRQTILNHEANMRHLVASQLYRTPPDGELCKQTMGARMYEAQMRWGMPLGFMPQMQ